MAIHVIQDNVTKDLQKHSYEKYLRQKRGGC